MGAELRSTSAPAQEAFACLDMIYWICRRLEQDSETAEKHYLRDACEKGKDEDWSERA